jgi:hypothetical protein
MILLYSILACSVLLGGLFTTYSLARADYAYAKAVRNPNEGAID